MNSINEELDTLLRILDPAHKIILNEKNMMIVKLHKNKKFYDWLTKNKIMPMIKDYHSQKNTMTFFNGDVNSRSSGPADPIFITLAIIPKSSINVNISCCNLDIQTTGNELFPNDKSSGIIFNGSYFYLEGHIRDGMYGINPRKNFNEETKVGSNMESNIESYKYIPIGYFRYDSDIHGNPETEQKFYKKTYDGYSLGYLNSNRDIYNKPELTLSAINDILGFAVFEKDKMTIQKYSEYYDNIQKPTTNVVMGNLLVYDDEIVMDEEKMCIAILLFSLDNKSGLYMYDKIYLCDDKYNKLSGSEINSLELDSVVHFVSCKNQEQRGKIYYNPKNIYMPYCLNFLKNAFPNNFAGKVPPGYLNHASDLNPRTCIMKDKNDNMIVMHVEGRKTHCGGVGIDLFDLAKLCRGMGAKYALNLDGGGSSKLLWKEENNSIEYVGLNSYRISNAIFIK